MARFAVDVGGGHLRRAMATLNAAGIPTIADRGDPGGTSRTRGALSRFFRSSAFVILVVIVLAFLAQRLFSAGPQDDAPSYDQFLNQVEEQPQVIERVTLDTNNTEIEVVQREGGEYTTGYPPSGEQSLVNLLRRQEIETVVEPGGGSGLLSLIAYLLPFLLILLFWLFLMRRTGGSFGQPPGGWESPGGSEPPNLRAVVEAESEDAAVAAVRETLAGVGDYRVGDARRFDFDRSFGRRL